MEIRNWNEKDYDQVQAIYAYAREFMKKTGNPNQWGDKSPREELLLADIKNKTGYVICDENNEIVGVFALILGKDPTYSYIEDGKWLNDEPYGTIHRIAGNGKCKGLLHAAVEFAFTKTDNIRIDTHHDNKVMQSCIAKEKFQRCGIIYIDDGSPRIAYQKVKEK